MNIAVAPPPVAADLAFRAQAFDLARRTLGYGQLTAEDAAVACDVLDYSDAPVDINLAAAMRNIFWLAAGEEVLRSGDGPDTSFLDAASIDADLATGEKWLSRLMIVCAVVAGLALVFGLWTGR